MLGLAIAIAISTALNLALLISQRTRKTILSSGLWLIERVRAICANPSNNSAFPGPPRKDEAAPPPTPPTPPPPPPPPPPTPAIIWPTVRPTAPPPPPPPRQPPRNLVYGAKGIFETGERNLHYKQLFEKIKPHYLSNVYLYLTNELSS